MSTAWWEAMAEVPTGRAPGEGEGEAKVRRARVVGVSGEITGKHGLSLVLWLGTGRKEPILGRPRVANGAKRKGGRIVVVEGM